MDTLKNKKVRYDIGKNGKVWYFDDTVNGTLLRRNENKSRTEEALGCPAARTVISYCTATLLYYTVNPQRCEHLETRAKAFTLRGVHISEVCS